MEQKLVNKKILQNNQGTGVVEMLVAMKLILFMSLALLLAFYLSTAHIWLNYRLHEAVVCLAHGYGVNKCRRTLIQPLSQTLPYGNLQKLSLWEDTQGWRGETVWTFQGPFRWKYKIHLHDFVRKPKAVPVP